MDARAPFPAPTPAFGHHAVEIVFDNRPRPFAVWKPAPRIRIVRASRRGSEHPRRVVASVGANLHEIKRHGPGLVMHTAPALGPVAHAEAERIGDSPARSAEQPGIGRVAPDPGREMPSLRRHEERIEPPLCEGFSATRQSQRPLDGPEGRAVLHLDLEGLFGTEREHNRADCVNDMPSRFWFNAFDADFPRQGFAFSHGTRPSPDLEFGDSAIRLSAAIEARLVLRVRVQPRHLQRQLLSGALRFKEPFAVGPLIRRRRGEVQPIIAEDHHTVKTHLQRLWIVSVPVSVRSVSGEAESGDLARLRPSQRNLLPTVLPSAPNRMYRQLAANARRRIRAIVKASGGNVLRPEFVPGLGERRDVRQMVAHADPQFRILACPVDVTAGSDAVNAIRRQERLLPTRPRRLVLFNSDLVRRRAFLRLRNGGRLSGARVQRAICQTFRPDREAWRFIQTTIEKITGEQHDARSCDIGLDRRGKTAFTGEAI